jgi:hypothetical protein
VDPKWVEPYTRLGLDETTARIYGMVANLDHNTGRLLTSLRTLGLEKDTILVFLTDNGPQQRRFNAGMRGLKGSVYQGGIRVPCFLRWPGRVRPGSRVDRIAAHVDLLPTLLEACEAPLPAGRQIDGRSLLPLATGTRTDWPDRKLFLQWHRGDAPEPHRNAAVRTQQWKLVNGSELYDLNQDPAESKDLASSLPQVTAELRKAYEEWFADVGRAGYAPPRIHIGAKQENPVLLTRQDWRGPRAGWDDNSLGFYEVEVRHRGPFEVTLRFPPQPLPRIAELEFRGQVKQVQVPANATDATLSGVTLPPGTGRLEGRIAAQPLPVGVHYIQIRAL